MSVCKDVARYSALHLFTLHQEFTRILRAVLFVSFSAHFLVVPCHSVLMPQQASARFSMPHSRLEGVWTALDRKLGASILSDFKSEMSAVELLCRVISWMSLSLSLISGVDTTKFAATVLLSLPQVCFTCRAFMRCIFILLDDICSIRSMQTLPTERMSLWFERCSVPCVTFGILQTPCTHQSLHSTRLRLQFYSQPPLATLRPALSTSRSYTFVAMTPCVLKWQPTVLQIGIESSVSGGK